MSLLSLLTATLEWHNVGPLVQTKVAELQELVQQIAALPQEPLDSAWADTGSGRVVVKFAGALTPDEFDLWHEKLAGRELELSFSPGPPSAAAEGYWIKVGSPFVSPLRRVGQAMGLFPNGIPGAPNALAATLVGGTLGAGLGYGAGALAEKLLPSDWQRNKLRRTLAIMGGLAGAAPGAALMTSNLGSDKPFYSGETLNTPPDQIESHFKSSMDYSDSQTGLFPPPINVAEFNQTIWQDPHVAGPLSPPMQAAATGLMTGAAQLSGRNWVTPADIARVAAGMGAGYLSGAIVGRTLGALVGLPPDLQNRLKQTGVWAGLISRIVPIAFGG